MASTSWGTDAGRGGHSSAGTAAAAHVLALAPGLTSVVVVFTAPHKQSISDRVASVVAATAALLVQYQQLLSEPRTRGTVRAVPCRAGCWSVRGT